MQKQAIGAPPDIELAIPRAPRVPRDGYPALAAWIAHDPDNESYVFRKFDRLSARNLLYLQSQLIALEGTLDRLDEETQESQDMELRLSAQRWETFVENAEDPDRPERRRMELAKVLQKKIKEYRKSTTILPLDFQNYRCHNSCGVSFSELTSSNANLYGRFECVVFQYDIMLLP